MIPWGHVFRGPAFRQHSPHRAGHTNPGGMFVRSCSHPQRPAASWGCLLGPLATSGEEHTRGDAAVLQGSRPARQWEASSWLARGRSIWTQMARSGCPWAAGTTGQQRAWGRCAMWGLSLSGMTVGLTPPGKWPKPPAERSREWGQGEDRQGPWSRKSTAQMPPGTATGSQRVHMGLRRWDNTLTSKLVALGLAAGLAREQAQPGLQGAAPPQTCTSLCPGLALRGKCALLAACFPDNPTRGGGQARRARSSLSPGHGPPRG